MGFIDRTSSSFCNYWILGKNSKGFIELGDRSMRANGDALSRRLSVYNRVSMHCDIVRFFQCVMSPTS